jgi:DNA modification methylase
MKLKDIKPNPGNPRVIKDARFASLLRSIQEFPKMLSLRPMVIDAEGYVLGGNMRLRALQELGYKEIPDDWVRRADDLTEEERQRFIIADNVGFGDWDWESLANDWDAGDLAAWGLEVPGGFGKDAEAQEDDYEVPEVVHTDIVIGDLFEIGEHRLLCGDSTDADEWAKLCLNEKMDLMITDPPYNVDYIGKTKDSLKIQNDKMSQSDFYKFLYDFYVSAGVFTKQGGAWYIWHADSEGHNFRKAFIDAGFKLAQCLIWKKSSMVMGRQDYHWKHEPCIYGWKEGAAHGWYSDRKQTTVLEFDRPNRNAEHPTMKPVELIAYLIGNSSKQGDIVGDGFFGSGTTMVAAHQLGRRCYGIEIDPKYCQVIVDRMIALDPSLEVKRNGKSYIKQRQSSDAEA